MNCSITPYIILGSSKGKYAQEGTYIAKWEILLIKKLDLEKTKPILVFTIQLLKLIQQISQGRKSVRSLAAAIYLYHAKQNTNTA